MPKKNKSKNNNNSTLMLLKCIFCSNGLQILVITKVTTLLCFKKVLFILYFIITFIP